MSESTTAPVPGERPSAADESAGAENQPTSDLPQAPPTAFSSPPPAPMPVRPSDDASRSRLHALAGELTKHRNRRLLVEFLRIRRSVR